MRRSYLGFCLLSFVVLGSSGAFAQKIIDKDQINDRIKELRARLKSYQNSIRNERETIELKFEKISEELESREDVAVTVLFHDSDSAVGPQNFDEADVSEMVNESSHALKDEIEYLSIDEMQAKRLEESKKRQQLFDSLRAKVQKATRRSRKRAVEINSMVAQIPDNN